MSKAITQHELSRISAIIREWPKSQKFKWENICIGAKSVLGYIPTRQALSKKPMLVNAYKAKRKQRQLNVDHLRKVARPQSMLDAMERISRLQEENELLKAELSKMAEVANLFIYNASIEGLSREKLMASMSFN